MSNNWTFLPCARNFSSPFHKYSKFLKLFFSVSLLALPHLIFLWLYSGNKWQGKWGKKVGKKKTLIKSQWEKFSIHKVPQNSFHLHKKILLWMLPKKRRCACMGEGKQKKKLSFDFYWEIFHLNEHEKNMNTIITDSIMIMTGCLVWIRKWDV